ncbi:MAG: PleD family two-component system response regulator [Vicinamibacterales bacterium]
MKALVVDDDPTSRFVLRLALNRILNWSSVEASNGVDALAKLGQQPVDLVFLDLHMPGYDGLQTLTAIRNSPAHAKLPVIVISADNDGEMVTRALALGISDYLLKPLTSVEIAARVARITSEAGANLERLA